MDRKTGMAIVIILLLILCWGCGMQENSSNNGTRAGILFEKGIIYKGGFNQIYRSTDYEYPDLEERYRTFMKEDDIMRM